MRWQKPVKIDLNCEYPCPCRRKGRLLPIILTEAMGCDRCQQIFVVTDKEECIEQLNPSYPYKKKWRWNGKRWIFAQKPWQESYFYFMISCFLACLLVSTPLLITLTGGFQLISGIIVGLILILLSISLWLAYHR
ncbi:hypothetical protein ACN4EE_13700 [Geminocystis sp. CENA526]|uniref:hypothetical protein n=1 Tax=Geminocystis sp. CENA526 TaxID=1355871 RepID=UPI003D6EBDAD